MNLHASPEEIRPEIIYQDTRVSIRVRPLAGTTTIHLLKDAVYGTSGPRYRQRSQEEKLPHLTGPRFFELYTGSAQVATYCLSERMVRTPAGEIPGFYGRYLAVHPEHGGKGYGNLLKQQAVAYTERQLGAQPHVFYSYVEAANGRSMRISARNDFADRFTLEALLFSRLYPKPDSRAHRLSPAQIPALQQMLNAHYGDHTLVTLDQIGYGGNYFVLREGEEIIAGVQANPVRWQICSMPGLSGKLIMHLFPRWGLTRRLVNPADYRFAALEGFYVKAGREPELIPLLEAVLAHLRLTSAMAVLDQRSPYARLLKQSGNLGIMNALKKPIYTKVMVKATHCDLLAISGNPPRPAYTSAFDYS
jgi:GNAT superfamily N-acetyltransferase